MKFKILRQIPEVFEVDADSYDEAVEKINNGEVEESEGLEDRFELIEEVNSGETDKS